VVGNAGLRKYGYMEMRVYGNTGIREYDKGYESIMDIEGQRVKGN